jgi:hypothetical protein
MASKPQEAALGPFSFKQKLLEGLRLSPPLETHHGYWHRTPRIEQQESDYLLLLRRVWWLPVWREFLAHRAWMLGILPVL